MGIHFLISVKNYDDFKKICLSVLNYLKYSDICSVALKGMGMLKPIFKK